MEGIKKGLKSLYNVSLFTSVVVFALGVFLIVNSKAVIDIISIIIGILFLIPGISSLVDYFKEKNQSSLVLAIICIIAGIVIMVCTDLVAGIIPFIFGIFFIINGITRLQYVLQVRKEYNLKNSKNLLLGILILLCGVMLILYRVRITEIAFSITGVFLCVYALLDIINHVMIKKAVKEVTKMQNAVIEIEAKEKDD